MSPETVCLIIILSIRGTEYRLTAESHKTMMKWMNALQVSVCMSVISIILHL